MSKKQKQITRNQRYVSLQQNFLSPSQSKQQPSVKAKQQQLKQEQQKKKLKPKFIKKTFSRLFRYTFSYKLLLLLANIGMIISSLGTIALPFLCGEMIDDIRNQKSLLYHSLQLLILSFILAIFSAIRGYCYNLIGEKVMYQLRTDLFSSLVKKDINYYDVNKSGQLISRLTSDIEVVQSAASDNISILLRNLIQFFGSLIFLWLISWKLTVFILVATSIFLIFIFLIIKILKKYKKIYQDNLALANSLANQVFGNIRIVKSFSTEIKQNNKYQRLVNTTYLVGKKQSILYGIMIFLMMIFANGLVLSVLYYGGSLVKKSEITIGQLTSYVLYTITMTAGLASVTGVINQMVSAIGVCEKIFQMIDAPIEVINGSYKQGNNYKSQGKIQFKNVSFNYPTKIQVKVLKQINLKILNGESLAFVGSSGSGKSSIISLILRFYDITSGEIKYDGINIKQYDLDHFRRRIGYVAQQPTLFSGSLRQNIVYGVDEICTEEQINKALEMANAKDFVYNKQMFPDGLNTLVGQRGVKLSGGQKQRIAIARCMIKNPQILIFDEATSALDAQSEFQVQKAIDGLLQKKDRTMIIIAHRLSTIINCDRIVVLKDGKIVQEGKHAFLLKQNGVYKSLIERQLSGFNI